jgi:type IV pilus assembly protein PilM
MLRLRGRPQSMVGLAILPENIHLVQLKVVKREYQLVRSVHALTPREVFVDGQIHAFSVLQKLLQTLIQTHDLQSSQTTVCVSANLVKMQRVMVPAGLSDNDLEAEMIAEANRLMSVKNEKIAVDYQVLPPSSKQEMPVFFAAARGQYLKQYADCVQGAGLKPAVMEVDLFAMMRIVKRALKQIYSEQEKWAMIYVTPEYGLIAACQKDELLFHKQWDAASSLQHKMTLQQWMEWCCQAYRQVGITHLAISGLSTVMMEVEQIILSYWSTQVVVVDPFTALHDSSSIGIKESSSYVLACGLAMREPLPWLN